LRNLTLYCSTPINNTDVANKAYVDSKSSSDVSFLMKKEFEGALVSDEGFLSATGDLASLTASAGKDMYLARAKCVIAANGVAMAASADQVVLKVNDVIIETCKSTILGSGGAGSMVTAYEFKNMGKKVLATEIIKLEVIQLDTQTDVEGFIECVEVDTGIDPTL